MSKVFFGCPGVLYGNLPHSISVLLENLDEARTYLRAHGFAIRDAKQAPYDRKIGVLLILRRMRKNERLAE